MKAAKPWTVRCISLCWEGGWCSIERNESCKVAGPTDVSLYVESGGGAALKEIKTAKSLDRQMYLFMLRGGMVQH